MIITCSMIMRWINGRNPTRQDTRKKKRAANSSRRRSAAELNGKPRNADASVSKSVLSLGVPHNSLYHSVLIIEWAFMQAKLTNVLHEADRLEVASANDSEGGEECEAILTAIRRAKRRGVRRAAKLLEGKKNGEDVEMVEDDRASTGGKTLPNLRLTLNGH